MAGEREPLRAESSPPEASPGPSSAAAKDGETIDRVAKVVAHSMTKSPRTTAEAILSKLDRLERAHLVLALQKAAARDVAVRRDTKWADDFIRGAEAAPEAHRLTRTEIMAALEYQRVLVKFPTGSADSPPSLSALTKIAVSTGVPFIGFGLIDNGIMITAGEQIDLLVGARLGISTLASAALGNIVADVVGVGVTQQIQASAKRVPWATPPRLSTLQQNLPSVRTTKILGAVLGVTIGCIMGMTPLLFRKDEGRGTGEGSQAT